MKPPSVKEEEEEQGQSSHKRLPRKWEDGMKPGQTGGAGQLGFDQDSLCVLPETASLLD